MSKNIENTNKTIKKETIEDMKKRVEKYQKQGGIITPDRRIYLDYTTKEEYISYKTYQNLIKRWEEAGKPENIHLKINPINITNDDKILPIETILDMEERVEKYKKQGGTISPERWIYLNIEEQYEYITYTKYQEIIERVKQFRDKNKRNPNFVYLKGKVEDTIKPNTKGWYISKRYSTNPEKMKQETNYWCGPNAIQLAWYELTGQWINESYIAKIAGTTTAGTGHSGLEKAIKTLGKEKNINININWEYLSELGYEKLAKLVQDTKTGIFTHTKYKNKYGHYEYIIGVNPSTEKLMINNSLSGGWIEYRSFATMTQYAKGISQKSICEIIKQ